MKIRIAYRVGIDTQCIAYVYHPIDYRYPLPYQFLPLLNGILLYGKPLGWHAHGIGMASLWLWDAIGMALGLHWSSIGVEPLTV